MPVQLASEVGIVPLRLFALKSSDVRPVMVPTLTGSTPVKPLCRREIDTTTPLEHTTPNQEHGVIAGFKHVEAPLTHVVIDVEVAVKRSTSAGRSAVLQPTTVDVAPVMHVSFQAMEPRPKGAMAAMALGTVP